MSLDFVGEPRLVSDSSFLVEGVVGVEDEDGGWDRTCGDGVGRNESGRNINGGCA